MAIITISRGTYGGSKDVASQLAKDLGYPVLSRETVLHEIDRDYGIPDKRGRSRIKSNFTLTPFTCTRK